MCFIPFYIFSSVFRAHWGCYLLACMAPVVFIAAISIVPCGFSSVNGINIYHCRFFVVPCGFSYAAGRTKGYVL